MSTLGLITLFAGVAAFFMLLAAVLRGARWHPIEPVSAGPLKTPEATRPKVETEWPDQHWVRTGLVLSQRSKDQWHGVVHRLNEIDHALNGASAQPISDVPKKFNKAWLDDRIAGIEQRAGITPSIDPLEVGL